MQQRVKVKCLFGEIYSCLFLCLCNGKLTSNMMVASENTKRNNTMAAAGEAYYADVENKEGKEMFGTTHGAAEC